MLSLMCLFFFFKQKTAYEMRISDWSSDVCSSDLAAIPKYRSNRIAYTFNRIEVHPIAGALGAEIGGVDLSQPLDDDTIAEIRQALLNHLVIFFRDQIGRAHV